VTAPLQTGTVEVTEERTDENEQTGEPEVAHIVRSGGGDAAARVLEARIYGTPLEALCGEIFVPRRDPAKLPMCTACREIYDLYRAMNDGLGETPDA
jgi:hypothetical protein